MPGRSAGSSPSGGSQGKRKGKAGGGNTLKRWPIPKGQKGLQSFLGGSEDGVSSSNSSNNEEGSSSAGSSAQLEEESADSSHAHTTPTNSPHTSSMNFLDDITQLNSDSDED